MQRGPTWAVVPVKALADAKRRLAPVLSSDLRRHLVLTMLDDVLTALREVETIDRVLVVTPDPDIAALATAKDTIVLREERAVGLNPALTRGLAHAQHGGATSAIIVPADVPLATADEVRSVVAAAANGGGRVALVSSADGDGTNALALAPPEVLAPSFGPGSFARHLARAVARRLDTRVLHMPGLAVDIDEPRDIAKLLEHTSGSLRYAFLRQGSDRDGTRAPDQSGAREQ